MLSINPKLTSLCKLIPPERTLGGDSAMLGPKFLRGLAVSVAILAVAGPARASLQSTTPDSAPLSASGRVFYVSPNGRDSNDGRSFATAWGTVNYAVDGPSVSPADPVTPVILLPAPYTDAASF